MLGIHQSENGIQQKAFGNFIVHEKCLRHRPRICQACNTINVISNFCLREEGGQRARGEQRGRTQVRRACEDDCQTDCSLQLSTIHSAPTTGPGSANPAEQ
jgi:hypothetical protein